MTRRLITIGICTFRRASLRATLVSIAAQDLPAGHDLRVVVADNDTEPVARPGILALGQILRLQLHYVHAPARNISVARNACLDAAEGSFLAFIDDDELAEANWIATLLAAWQRTGAGAIFGPTVAIYPPEAPGWMARGDFHSNIPHDRRGVVETGYSSNVLLDLQQPAVRTQRFDPALGQTGGEDVDFFFRLHRRGVRMEIEMAARVREAVTAPRLSLRWIFGRRFSTGQIYGHCLLRSARQAGLATRMVVLGKSLGKSLYCSGRAVLALTRRERFWFWLMRGGFHLGVAAGAMAAPQRANYGGEQPT